MKDIESDLNLSKLQRFKHQQSERIPLYLLATPESVQLGGKHVLLLSLGLLQVVMPNITRETY